MTELYRSWPVRECVVDPLVRSGCSRAVWDARGSRLREPFGGTSPDTLASAAHGLADELARLFPLSP
ncbi:hypothetical protein [Streptomyces sp. NPDC060035]|uniref:hypothetical protein n=1 Tax=Streptomyces sp. NPDC060035 TaxID=3347044 RepID=UPI00369BF73B